MRVQVKNTAASLALQIVTILCGLILPRQILLCYGSEMNGLNQAIGQFLQYSSLLECGMGVVLPAALYRPLAEGDERQVSAIMLSGERLFRRIAAIHAGYTLLLLFVFPALSGYRFPMKTTSLLLLSSSISTIVTYLWGKTEFLLLYADQKGYVPHLMTVVSLTLRTAAAVYLIRSGAELYTVKFVSVLFVTARVLLLRRYVRRRYALPAVEITGEPIPQKWKGTAQHIAFFVLEHTDIVVLTLFATLQDVSVYAIYYMVLSAIRRLFTAATYTVLPRFGELWVREDRAALNRFFSRYARLIHFGGVLLFTCTGLLIVPFVQVYTSGVRDAEYTQPLFAVLLVLSQALCCIRDPYDKLILGAGHFKQTQHYYVIAAVINIVLSVLTVRRFGLVGVAVGTLVSMVYQLVFMALYNSRVLLRRSLSFFVRQLLADAALAAAIVLLAGQIRLPVSGYLSWILRAAAVTGVAAVITALFALVLKGWLGWSAPDLSDGKGGAG